jgi:hypothetical protein
MVGLLMACPSQLVFMKKCTVNVFMNVSIGEAHHCMTNG